MEYFLLRIRKVPVSNLGSDTQFYKTRTPWLSSRPPGKGPYFFF
jgi:hypothetical protein